MAFWLDAFLPSSVLGPVDFWAFCLFDINCFSLVDIVIGLCCKSQAGNLGGFVGEFDSVVNSNWKNNSLTQANSKECDMFVIKLPLLLKYGSKIDSL